MEFYPRLGIIYFPYLFFFFTSQDKEVFALKVLSFVDLLWARYGGAEFKANDFLNLQRAIIMQEVEKSFEVVSL